MNIQELLESTSYARVQNGFNREQFLDASQMHSKDWFGDEDYREGGMSACKDFEALMQYISVTGMPDGYDTVVLFDGHYKGYGKDEDLGEVLIEATSVECAIKFEDIEGFYEYLDELWG